MRRKAKWAATAVKEQFQACCTVEGVLSNVQDNDHEAHEKDEDFCSSLRSMQIANVTKATSIAEVSWLQPHQPTGVERPCAPILVHGKSMITKIETRECETTSLQTCNKISVLLKEEHVKQQQLPVVLASPMKLNSRSDQCFATPISQNVQSREPHYSQGVPFKIEPIVLKVSKGVVDNVDNMAKTSKHGAQQIQQSQAKPVSKQVLQKGTWPLKTKAHAFKPKDFGAGVSMHYQASPPPRLKKHVSGPLPQGIGISSTSNGICNRATRSPHTDMPKLKHVSGPLPRTHVGMSQGVPQVGSPCSASQLKTNKQQMSKSPLGHLELMAILGSMKNASKRNVPIEENKWITKSDSTGNIPGIDNGKRPSSGTNTIHEITCNQLQGQGASKLVTCVPDLTMLERWGSQRSGALRDQGERMSQVGQDGGGCLSSAMRCQAALAHASTSALASLPPPLSARKRVINISMSHHLKKEKHHAAIKIQAAFRGFLVRRTSIQQHCVNKDQVKVDVDEEVEHVEAQSLSTCMSRIEVQHDKKMQQVATTNKEWNSSIRTAEDYQALLHNKKEAAMKRERGLEYALLRQHWKAGSRSHKGRLQWHKEDQVADKLGWVWSWLDRATHDQGVHSSKNHNYNDSPDFHIQQCESASVRSTEGVCTTDIGSHDLDYQGWKNSQEWPLSLRQQHAIGLLQSNQSAVRKSPPIQHEASITVSPMSTPTNNATPPQIEVAKPPNLCQVCAQDIVQLEDNGRQHLQSGSQDVSTTSESRLSMASEASADKASKFRVQNILNFLEDSTMDDQESVGSCPGLMGPSVSKQLTSPFVGSKMRSQNGRRQPTCVLQHKLSTSHSNKETLIQAQISVALSDDGSVGTTAASVQQALLRL